MEDINHYAPPQAQVDDVPEAGLAITLFPRLSTWWVLLLAVVTFSLYLVYWMYTRSKVLERIAPSRRIAPALIFVAMALYVVGFLAGIAEGAYRGQPNVRSIKPSTP
jgi:hypothetical protein